MPRVGALKEDLEKLFRRLSGEVKTFEFVRSSKTVNRQPVSSEAFQTSDHLARLWANDEVARILAARDESLNKAEAASGFRLFSGLGYSIKPLALHRDDSGSLWSSFSASKGNERLRVYERINSESGESWTDVSAWYWSALHQGGPWWAITVAEKELGPVCSVDSSC